MLLDKKAGILHDLEQRQRERHTLLGCSPEKIRSMGADTLPAVDVPDPPSNLLASASDLPGLVSSPSNMYTVLGGEETEPSQAPRRASTISAKLPVSQRPEGHRTRLRALTRALVSLYARHTVVGLVAAANAEAGIPEGLEKDLASMQGILQSLYYDAAFDAQVPSNGTGFLRTFLRSFSRGLGRPEVLAATNTGGDKTRKHRTDSSKTPSKPLTAEKLDARHTTLDHDAITLLRQVVIYSLIHTTVPVPSLSLHPIHLPQNLSEQLRREHQQAGANGSQMPITRAVVATTMQAMVDCVSNPKWDGAGKLYASCCPKWVCVFHSFVYALFFDFFS